MEDLKKVYSLCAARDISPTDEEEPGKIIWTCQFDAGWQLLDVRPENAESASHVDTTYEITVLEYTAERAIRLANLFLNKA